jgi:hypothetical protein
MHAHTILIDMVYIERARQSADVKQCDRKANNSKAAMNHAVRFEDTVVSLAASML